MAQRTLAAPPLNPILQEWIASHAASINRIASTLGIPAGALASVPAEEASHIISAVRGKNKYYPLQSPTDFFQDNIVPLFMWHEYYADGGRWRSFRPDYGDYLHAEGGRVHLVDGFRPVESNTLLCLADALERK